MAGRDFNPDEVLSVPAQVDKLIIQATSLENLCQCFSGWYVRALLVASESVDDRATGVHSGDSRGYLDLSHAFDVLLYTCMDCSCLVSNRMYNNSPYISKSQRRGFRAE